MYKLLEVFAELGMSERSAKTMRTRVCKAVDVTNKEEYSFNELEKILKGMTGKYQAEAKKYLFALKAKDYDVEVKQVALIEEQDDFDYIPKIFDLVWVGRGENRTKGIIVRKIVGNHAEVMMSTGSLEGQEVKVRVNDLFPRVRGEK
jgi:hypothetical protein